MNTIIVSYDLHDGDEDYQDLYDYFESYGNNYYKLLESTCALYCNKTPKKIRDGILDEIGKSHSIFVTDAGASAWHNILCSNDVFKNRNK